MGFTDKVVENACTFMGAPLAETVVLYYDEVYYAKMIDDLVAKKSKLQAHRDKINNLAQQLEQHWNTGASAQYRQDMIDLTEKIDGISDRIDKAQQYLHEVIETLYTEEQKAQAKAEDVHAVISTFVP